jgi:hypothetical protein
MINKNPRWYEQYIYETVCHWPTWPQKFEKWFLQFLDWCCDEEYYLYTGALMVEVWIGSVLMHFKMFNNIKTGCQPEIN